MNVMFHEIDEAKIYQGDSLINSAFYEGNSMKKFDIVAGDPPKNRANKGIAATMDLDGRSSGNRWFNLSFRSSGSLMFVDRAITLAKPKSGRIVITVPQSFLFRSIDELEFCKKLAQESILDAVVSIPNGVSNSSPPSAIVVIDRSREQGGPNASKKEVTFIDASESYKKREKLCQFCFPICRRSFFCIPCILN